MPDLPLALAFGSAGEQLVQLHFAVCARIRHRQFGHYSSHDEGVVRGKIWAGCCRWQVEDDSWSLLKGRELRPPRVPVTANDDAC